MRLFTAIECDPTTKDAIEALTAQLKPRFKSGSFTLKDNLHLTLAFIGETRATQAAADAMDSLTAAPFTLVFDKVGTFKRGGEAIVWLGAAYVQALFDMQKSLAHALRQAGFAIEDKAYTPHITLCRRAVLNEALPAQQVSIAQPVTAVSLMRSERDASGALRYTCIHKKYL